MSVTELNIGGQLYTTTLETLRNAPEGSKLSKMFSKPWNGLRDSSGRIFIDRDGDAFKYILDYLRDPNTCFLPLIPPPPSYSVRSTELRMRLLREAWFYGLSDIIADFGYEDVWFQVTDDMGKKKQTIQMTVKQLCKFPESWHSQRAALMGSYKDDRRRDKLTIELKVARREVEYAALVAYFVKFGWMERDAFEHADRELLQIEAEYFNVPQVMEAFDYQCANSSL